MSNGTSQIELDLNKKNEKVTVEKRFFFGEIWYHIPYNKNNIKIIYIGELLLPQLLKQVVILILSLVFILGGIKDQNPVLNLIILTFGVCFFILFFYITINFGLNNYFQKKNIVNNLKLGFRSSNLSDLIKNNKNVNFTIDNSTILGIKKIDRFSKTGMTNKFRFRNGQTISIRFLGKEKEIATFDVQLQNIKNQPYLIRKVVFELI